MSISKYLVIGLFSGAFFHPLLAERHCPGNVPSVPLRFVQRTQIVVAVEINHSGPYDFLLDTGAQVSMVDTRLASQLGLDSEGTTGVVGVGSRSAGGWTHLSTIEAGSVSVENELVLVQDLGHLESIDRRIRGILGGNFLGQFDLFIDYEHPLLCLDSSGAMGQALKGKRTEIVAVPHAKEEAILSTPLIIRAHFPDRTARDLLLLLDSGTNAAVLYDSRNLPTTEGTRARGIDGANRAFSLLPANDLQVEGNRLRDISFITPAAGADVPRVPFDGLLPTSVFKRIFVCYSGGYVEIDPQR